MRCRRVHSRLRTQLDAAARKVTRAMPLAARARGRPYEIVAPLASAAWVNVSRAGDQPESRRTVASGSFIGKYVDPASYRNGPVACSIRVSTRAFVRIWRIVRKPKYVKFFVFNNGNGFESHPLRQHELLCFQ